MMIKKSPKEVFTPSTVEIFGPKNREKFWQRQMRHRLMALEQRLDDIEELIKELHPKELGV